MKNKFIHYIILSCSILFAHDGDDHKKNMPAIGKVQGMVADSSTGIPLEYASISIIDFHSNDVITGGLTKKDGSFSIEEIPLGNYYVLIEFMGYKKKEIDGIILGLGNDTKPQAFLGEIVLQISTVNLDVVEVIGEENQFIQTIDKQIFNVGKNLSASGGNGADVLRKVPTVDVDIDGQVSIAGDANVTVLIDGKRSGLTGSARRGLVENIAASMIDKVEVITNPSAKYDPDGVGGIINIKLKRGSFDGFNGSISGMAGEFDKKNVNANINYRTSKYNIFGSSNLRSGSRIGEGHREFQYIYASPNRIDSLFQDTKSIKRPIGNNFRLGGDYYPSSAVTLSYTYDYGIHEDNNVQSINYLIPSDIGEIETREDDNGLHHDHNFSYENRFGDNSKKLSSNLSINFEEDKEVEYSDRGNIAENNQPNDTDTKESNKNWMFSLDFENKVNQKLKYEAGLKGTLKDFDTDYGYLGKSYINKYTENLFALYAQFTFDITNRFGIKAGARIEDVKTKASLNSNELQKSNDGADSLNIITTIISNSIDESPFNNPYFQIYPSMYLIYKLTDKNTVQFGYSKKVNRPSRRTLSPFPNSSYDLTRIRNGNPYLNPEYSDIAELKFSSNSRKINFNTGISYKLVSDNIMWWDRDYVVHDSTSYEILTADNSENSESLGGSVILNYRPMPLINLMLSNWWWKNRTYGNGESDLNGSSAGYWTRGQLTMNIPKLARLELSVGGRGKMKITTGTIPANFKADIGIQKYFLNNKLSVTIKTNDIFNSGKFVLDTKINVPSVLDNEGNIITDSYTQLMYAERRRDTRFTTIVLNYNFGKQSKKRWKKGNYSRSGSGGMDMDY